MAAQKNSKRVKATSVATAVKNVMDVNRTALVIVVGVDSGSSLENKRTTARILDVCREEGFLEMALLKSVPTTPVVEDVIHLNESDLDDDEDEDEYGGDDL